MSRELLLSDLVAKAHIMRAQDAARIHAAKRGEPVYIIRTKAGYRCTALVPPYGEHWSVQPSGQVTHVESPVT